MPQPQIIPPQQRPLRILSLDGGGVRGYSMLLLLQEVMLKLFVEMEGRAPKRWEIPRPCDHFDLIAGTGTGGLIAIILGRLRLDLETALELYVDMTRRVFETDKTLGGMPYRKTLYKASKLEEAIKEVVSMYETADTSDPRLKYPHISPQMIASPWGKRPKRSNTLPTSRSLQSSPQNPDQFWKPQMHDPFAGESAFWYDERPGSCKTFVTAVYKGSSPSTPPALLRTYDSPAETTPFGRCTIWEAGRATCAVFPAFKSIQVGQNLFEDEGHGAFNPSLIALEEALQNEWPGRKLGVFVSIGSGKLPPAPPEGVHSTRSNVRDSIIGATPLQKFVDARESHIQKIEECERLHQETIRAFRAKGLDENCYFRLNVDTGVGSAGMAEWFRLAEISNGTRAYLTKPAVQKMNASAAKKLAKIWRQAGNLPGSLVHLTCAQLNKSLPELPRDFEPSQPESSTSPTVAAGNSTTVATTSTTTTTTQYVSRPIVPNLASEFSQMSPPCAASSNTGSGNSARMIRRRPPPPPLPFDIFPPTPPLGSGQQDQNDTQPRPQHTTQQQQQSYPSPPAPAYAPPQSSQSSTLPPYQPTSARITDFSQVDLEFPIPERMPTETPKIGAGDEMGLGIQVGQNAYQQEPQHTQTENDSLQQYRFYQPYSRSQEYLPGQQQYQPRQRQGSVTLPIAATTSMTTTTTVVSTSASPTQPQSSYYRIPQTPETPQSLEQRLARQLARQRREGDGEVSGDEYDDEEMRNVVRDWSMIGQKIEEEEARWGATAGTTGAGVRARARAAPMSAVMKQGIFGGYGQ